MIEHFDISEVVRRTGLTGRALRFYEARGLVAPLRTDSGRRIYGAGELARLHQIVVLKGAGLTLAQIGKVLAGKAIDLPRLLHAQLELLDEEAARIAAARASIRFALSRIDRGEPVDAATFCSLIETGDKIMTQDPKVWDTVTDRYFTPEEKAEFAEKMHEVPGDFDQQAYAAQWRELSARIKAALPLDPAGKEAQAFLAEWQRLLEPFNAVATPAMKEGVQNFYERMDEWEGEVDPGFDKQVFDFIQSASRAAKS